MPLDIDAIRAEFPSLATQDNNVRRIYFDNPAGTQIPRRVAAAVADTLLHSSANQKGPFRTSKAVDAVVVSAREALADLLNAPSADEIVFGQSMTALTFQLARSLGLTMQAGDEIIVTDMDHDANIHPWNWMAREHGLIVRRLRFDPGTCEFRLQDLKELISDRTRLICVGGASNLTGTLHDIEAMCALARDAGAMSFVDGVQLVPHVPTDVQKIGCDFLVCSAYKFFGPHQGVLWSHRLGSLEPVQVRPALVAPPACFELGTPSFEAMAGTTAAVNYLAWIGDTMADEYLADFSELPDKRQQLHAAMAALFDYEKQLARRLIQGLVKIPGVRVYGVTDDFDKRVPTVAITADSMSPKALADRLAEHNIFVWHGHNYALELVRTLGLENSGGVVRIGPVHYNTVDEVDDALAVLGDILDAEVGRIH